MREEVYQTRFIARLVYNILHIVVLGSQFVHNSTISKMVDNRELFFPILLVLSFSFSTYLFYTIGNNPGYVSFETCSNYIGLELTEVASRNQEIELSEKTISTNKNVNCNNEELVDGSTDNMQTLMLINEEKTVEPQMINEKSEKGSKEINHKNELFLLESNSFSSEDIEENLHEDNKHSKSHTGDYSFKDDPFDKSRVNVVLTTELPEPIIITNFCKKCNREQINRSKHCSQCEACVSKFDHHCCWIGSCVGELNHGKYWFLLTSLSFHQLQLTIYTFDSIMINMEYENPQDVNYGQKQIGLYVICFLLSFQGFLFTFLLFIFHTYVICINTTTREHVKRNNLSYMKKYKQWEFPYDLGFKQNVKTICFSSKEKLNNWDIREFQSKNYQRKFNVCENKYYNLCTL